MEERSRKGSRKQTLQLTQIFVAKLELNILLMFKKIDKKFASILCMNTIFIQSATIVRNMNFIY
jgi:hypothetical protein